MSVAFVTAMKQVPVLIAGGGPVGMTLACELSRRGVACLLVERNPTTTRHPKMDITNARSMELFRRLGVADALRDVAVPESSNFDVSWITNLTGYELHRFRYPSVTEWRRMIRDRNDGSMPGEPPMRVSQVEIEPVLQRAVQASSECRGAMERRARRCRARRCGRHCDATHGGRDAPSRFTAPTWSAATAAPAGSANASTFAWTASGACSSGS